MPLEKSNHEKSLSLALDIALLTYINSICCGQLCDFHSPSTGFPDGQARHGTTESVVGNRVPRSTKVRYLTLKQLQEKLGGRGRTTIYRDVEYGRLPRPKKIGSRLYWAEAEIDDTISRLTS